MTPGEDACRQQIRQALLTVFGCCATRDEYSTEHLLAVLTRLLGGPPLPAELLEAELHNCPFARVRSGPNQAPRWRFVNASSVRPRRSQSGPQRRPEDY